MYIQTPRLIITDLTPQMAEVLHRNSLDENTRRFLPDEVFETPQEALDTISFLIGRYGTADGPFVHPVLTLEGQNIGYVELVPKGDSFEIGYHIAEPFTGKGYASEAVTAFLPGICAQMGLTEVWGVCRADNLASARVLEKCGFTKIFEGPELYQGKIRPIKKYIWKTE